MGPCSGSLIQFYHDSRLRRCLEFDYSGCQGNANRFDTLAACEERCGADREGTEPPLTTPASVTGGSTGSLWVGEVTRCREFRVTTDDRRHGH